MQHASSTDLTIATWYFVLICTDSNRAQCSYTCSTLPCTDWYTILVCYKSSSLCSSKFDSLSGGLGASMPDRVLQLHGRYFRKLTPRAASLHHEKLDHALSKCFVHAQSSMHLGWVRCSVITVPWHETGSDAETLNAAIRLTCTLKLGASPSSIVIFSIICALAIPDTCCNFCSVTFLWLGSHTGPPVAWCEDCAVSAAFCHQKLTSEQVSTTPEVDLQHHGKATLLYYNVQVKHCICEDVLVMGSKHQSATSCWQAIKPEGTWHGSRLDTSMSCHLG